MIGNFTTRRIGENIVVLLLAFRSGSDSGMIGPGRGPRRTPLLPDILVYDPGGGAVHDVFSFLHDSDPNNRLVAFRGRRGAREWE
jgi:hypothetical protein